MGKRRKVATERVRTVFVEYCSSSSIHGVQYFGSRDRTCCEKFWWLVVFLLAMTGCGLLIYKAYRKWECSPVIVTFSEKTTPVSEIPFPAVTICPETKTESRLLNLTGELENLDQSYNLTVVKQMKAVAQLCNELFQERFARPLHFVETTDEDRVVQRLKQVHPRRESVIASCWFGNDLICDDLIQDTITDEGVCFSFNALTQEQILREGVVQGEYRYLELSDALVSDSMVSLVKNPLKARNAGLNGGVDLSLLQNRNNLDYLCKGYSQGYRVILHEVTEYPHIAKRNIRIPLGQEVTIAVKPQMIVTSSTLEDYSWQKRQCFFNNERYLQFFHVYTQDNCELECLTNYTLKLCECVRFSMPRTNDTQVCPLFKWDCMEHARSSIVEPENDQMPVSEASKCNCLPACSAIQYDTEITQTTLDFDKFRKAIKIADISDDVMVSGLIIYFKESQFITSKRTELYGLVEFLANCGGLLGLFMGVSLLSLVEICYFVLIRPFSLLRRESNGSVHARKEVLLVTARNME